MNILDYHKINNFLNKYFGFSLPASKTVLNSSEIIQGSLVGPLSAQGVLYLYRGLRRASQSYFGLILEF